MRDLFKPWRRKIGIFALVMACVFAAGWVRSLSVLDFMSIPLRGWTSAVAIETDGHLVVGVSQRTDNILQPFMWASMSVEPIEQILLNDTEKVIDIRLFGCGPVAIKNNFGGLVALVIPYWFIAFPLSLISCWLLISKPRQLKVKPPVQSIPETAA